MQDIEFGRAFGWIARVEPRDLGAGMLEDFQIGGALLGVAVLPVGQKRKMQRSPHIGEVVNFQRADALLNIVARVDKRGHDDQRTLFGGIPSLSS